VESNRCNGRHLDFFTGALCFLCQVSLKTTHPTHADKVNAVIINQGQYE